jgi:cytochrome c oxidase assembly factor CtaG/cytochrome c2
MRGLTTLAAAASLPLALAAVGAMAFEGTKSEENAVVPIVAIGAASLLFLRGYRRLAGRSPNAMIGPRHACCLLAALADLALTLSPVVDEAADALFSAHMGQHLSLILVVAPLLALGQAGLLAWAGLPVAWRTSAGRIVARHRLHQRLRTRGAALVCWPNFLGAFVFWHLPGPYRWGLENPVLHAFEHLLLLGTASWFWAVAFARGRTTLSYGERLLFVSTMAVLSGLPGALMILSPRRLYVSSSVISDWGLTPVDDQQLAGLIMWIPGSLIFLAAIAWLAFRWLETAGSETRTVRQNLRPLGPCLLVAAALPFVAGLAGCSPQAEARTGSDDAAQGARIIAETGCGACHVIPGIEGANGQVGPPLTQVGRRVFLAGLLRNTPDNMIYWLQNPQAVVPGNAMPNSGLSDADASRVAAYLATLR